MSWRDNLLPASFRGVAFYVKAHEFEGGRRKAKHQYPGRDKPYPEDLGRKARGYHVEAYVIGDDYMAGRDALLDACESYAGAGTLIHPYLGAIQVSCETVSFSEKIEEGGIARFNLTFIEEPDAPPAPVAASNTSLTALNQITATFASLDSAFATAFSIVDEALFTVEAGIAIASALMNGLVALSGVPISYLPAVAAAFSGVTGQIGAALLTPTVFAAAVTAAFQAYGDAVVAYTADLAAGTASDLTGIATLSGAANATPSYSSSAVDIANDPTGGLAGFAANFAASWSVLPSAATPDLVAQGVNQQAMTDLVNAAAALAVAQIFAQGDFDSSNAAAAARDQLIDLFCGPVERAADTDADDLYQTLRDARAAALADIAARGASLPALVDYATPSPRTALGLAHLLYPDWPILSATAPAAAQAWGSLDDIVADLIRRNQVVHPAFLPISGEALAS